MPRRSSIDMEDLLRKRDVIEAQIKEAKEAIAVNAGRELCTALGCDRVQSDLPKLKKIFRQLHVLGVDEAMVRLGVGARSAGSGRVNGEGTAGAVN